MKFVLIYLALVNVAGFALMHADKKKAVKGKWRIRERTLLWTAALGGSLGALAGMQLFRHKTRHPAFFLGIPAMLFGHILLAILAAYFYFQ